MRSRFWAIIPSSLNLCARSRGLKLHCLSPTKGPTCTCEPGDTRTTHGASSRCPTSFRAADTALIMVHPWAIDDGQGWKTPEPNGVCDFCTPTKNHLAARHTHEVINPFLKSLRGKVAFVMYSLPGPGDSIRKKVYRTFGHSPSVEERTQGKHELKEKLASLSYKGEALPAKLTLSSDKPVADYFRQFPGLDAGPKYNGAGFWDVPIPVTKDIDTDPADVVIFDAEGYPALRDFLKKNKVRHVLLTGYATDMCYCRTTAGYLNLSKDFNVFLVGDASLATFPSNSSPRFATNASLSFAAHRPVDHANLLGPLHRNEYRSPLTSE